MVRVLLFTLAFVMIVPPAFAQRAERLSDIAPESYRAELPGPGRNEHRTIFFWRPRNAPAGPLPVLYVADGLGGLDIMGARIRDAIIAGRARPIVIVATDASQRRRQQEYVPGDNSNPDWERHYTWYVETVLPWAERNVGASTDPLERGVAGVSNGADFAISIASRRPDLFSRVIAHSAANLPPEGFRTEPGSRWVLTAGLNEGDNFPGVAARLGLAIDNRPIRHCLGPWRHDARSWREVSPGALAWLFDLGEPATLETEVERASCITYDTWAGVAEARRAQRR